MYALGWDWIDSGAWWSALGHLDSQPSVGKLDLMEEIRLDVFKRLILIMKYFF